LVEKAIIVALIVMMAGVLALATIELGYHLVRTILYSEYLLISLENLMDLFGIFLLVLIGIELLDTIKVYLKQNVVHVEVVVLVAIIALARKIVILEIEYLSGEIIIGLGVLLAGLAIAYYLIKKTGLLVLKAENNSEKEIKNDLSAENRMEPDITAEIQGEGDKK